MRILLLIFLLTPDAHASEKLLNFSFDWDDNILFMPTKIILFKKKSHLTKEVSTAKYAQIKKLVGVKGTNWQDFEHRVGSYKYFRSTSKINYFLRDIKLALKNLEKAKGPSWDEFIKAMNNATLASQTTIITARGHSRDHFMSGLKYLQSIGLIKYIPIRTNFWGVTDPQFPINFKRQFKESYIENTKVSSPSKSKARVILKLLDSLNSKPIPKKAKCVLSVSGEKCVFTHLWGFSDDDYDNFEKARNLIQENLNQGKWKNVKITLFFTGLHHPSEKPKSIVLRPNQTPRKYLEDKEWKTILLTK